MVIKFFSVGREKRIEENIKFVQSKIIINAEFSKEFMDDDKK